MRVDLTRLVVPWMYAVGATLLLQALALGLIGPVPVEMHLLLGGPLVFLTPLPVALLGLRGGPVAAGLALATVTLVLAGLAPFSAVLLYLAQFGLGSWLLPLLLRRNQPWDRAVALTAGVVLTGAGAGWGVWAWRRGQHPLILADSWVRQQIDRTVTVIGQNAPGSEIASSWETAMRQAGNTIMAVYPAMAAIMVGSVLLLLTLMLVRLNRGRWEPAGKPFPLWKAPEHLIWLLIVCGLGSQFFGGGLQRLAWNMLLVILSLYFLQGLAIVRYYFGVKGTPSILRGMGYFMLLAYFPLRLLLAGVGVFDLWIDFRKPRIRKD
jgi:hypothetical protein